MGLQAFRISFDLFSTCFEAFQGPKAQQTAAGDVRAVLVGRLRAKEADDQVDKHHQGEGVQEDLIVTLYLLSIKMTIIIVFFFKNK